MTLGAVLGVPNTSCADSATYPLQLLWLGSVLDTTSNASAALSSMGRFRASLQSAACPTVPPSASTPHSVAYSRWSSGDPIEVAVCGGRMATGGVPSWVFGDVFDATAATVSVGLGVEAATVYTTGVTNAITDPSSVVSVVVAGPNSTASADTGALRLQLSYVGGSRMSGLRVIVRVAAGLLLRCVGSEMLEITYELEAPPKLADTESIADGAGVGSTVASGLTGSPSGVVRGGLLSSLSDLLRCEPPDLTAEQSLLSNLFNIALGPAEGQYYRGGILSGVIVLCGIGVLLGGIAVGSKMVSLRRQYAAYVVESLDDKHHIAPPRWMDAVRHSHLPGLMLVPMALVGEAFVPNGATLMSMDGAGVWDVALGASAVIVFAAYIAHLLWTTLRVRNVGVRCEGEAGGKGPTGAGRLLRYWLHSPAMLVPTGLTDERWANPTPQQYSELLSYVSVKRNLMDESSPDVGAGLSWLMWYAPYSDELTVLWFKAVELALGSAVNLIGGIVTDSCLAQGSATLVVVGAVLVVMVVKRPLAVRAQQLTTTVVYGSMFVSSVVVVANLFAQRPQLEDAASVLFMVSTAVTLLQSCVDVLISVVAAHALLRAFWRRRERSRKMKANCSPLLAGTALLERISLEDGEVSADSELGSVDRESEVSTVASRVSDETPEVDERVFRDALLDELEELDREIEMQSIKSRRKKGRED